MAIIVATATGVVAPSVHASSDAEEAARTYGELIGGKKFAEAQQALDTKIDQDPDNAVLYLWRGNVFWSICDYRNAIADFDRVIAIDTRDTSEYQHKLLLDAYLHKGVCLARLGAAEAPAVFLEAARNQYVCANASPQELTTIGKALLESGQRAEALKFIARLNNTDKNKNDKNKSAREKARAALLELSQLAARGKPPAIEVMRRDNITAGLDSIIATRHFIFISDIDDDRLARYATIAESFLQFINDNFYAIDDNKYPVSFFILHDKAAERAFLKERLNFPYHVHGVFMSSRNILVTYDGVGDGVFLHEIMHKVFDGVKLEYWAEEGIPSFFEKVYGALKPQFTLKLGYPANNHPRMIDGQNFQLDQIVSSARHADPSKESEQHLVSLFLYRHKKLKAYLDLLGKVPDKKYKSNVEAVFEKNSEQLNLLFKEYLQEILNDRKKIEALPPSHIFQTTDELPEESK